jgi:8-oxo-dGTP pyrophosphatase MutT (NUDIX family)
MDIDALASDLHSHPAQDPILSGELTQAAVAVILRPGDGPAGFDLLFIQRAEHPSDPWSGHMAFPGGRVDPGDISREAAAVREVAEEVGIDLPACGRMLGRLEQVASPPMRRRVVMTPYVWVLSGDVPLHPEASEVASTHWFGLDRFLSDEGRGTFEYRFRGSIVPLSRVDLDGHRIWGMTLRVVDELLERLRAVQ